MKIEVTKQRNMVRVMIGKKPMYLTRHEAYLLQTELEEVFANEYTD